jgi:DNA modification methylase
MVYKIIKQDCLEFLKTSIGDSKIDLILTSPPYADAVSYGKNVSIFSVDKYADWFIPIGIEISRVMKDTGSFILNINDKRFNGERSIYVYDLVCRLVRETNLKLYDRYIWAKKSGLPNGSERKLDDKIEYIFHFVNDVKKFKSNMDRIREPYAPISIKRMETPVGTQDDIDENGITKTRLKKVEPNPLGKVPNNILRFNTSGVLKGQNHGKHPAQFNPELPEFFIKWLTDENDLVYDPFTGGGTTGKVSIQRKRNFIGTEINEEYIKIAEENLKSIIC